MTALSNMTRTEVSAVISVVLFGMTILISAVGPAEAQGTTVIDSNSSSPTVSYKA
ncbi:MAG: hypothetical protein AAGM33_08300 [Pseudomonadota bacterium]